jgi:DNA-directed RNA polymerase subunit RPC12/RpoP
MAHQILQYSCSECGTILKKMVGGDSYQDLFIANTQEECPKCGYAILKTLKKEWNELLLQERGSNKDNAQSLPLQSLVSPSLKFQSAYEEFIDRFTFGIEALDSPSSLLSLKTGDTVGIVGYGSNNRNYTNILMTRLSIRSLLSKRQAHTISSELDYIKLTNEFYDQSWQSNEEAEERIETIWTIVRYIYRANLSEERMIELLRTRSGLLTINSYSRSHLEEILILDKQISLATNIEEKLELQRRIRMYSINVPVIKSVNFTNRIGNDDREYIIVEADYDPVLGLLIDL